MESPSYTEMLTADEGVKQSISITQLALQLRIMGKTLHLCKATVLALRMFYKKFFKFLELKNVTCRDGIKSKETRQV